MQNADDNADDLDPQAPEKLVTALRRSQAERVFVPPTIDEVILRAARERFGRRQRNRFTWLLLLPWTIGATAVFVAVALILVRFQPRRGSATPSTFAKQDINHDGRVDILDAFALARQLKHGTVSDLRLDINGDGVVDERDFRIIATEAVKLDKGGHS